jgi:hypothetical protein
LQRDCFLFVRRFRFGLARLLHGAENGLASPVQRHTSLNRVGLNSV